MALTGQDLTLYAGETKTVTFSLTGASGNPLDITGGTLTWHVGINSLDTVNRIEKATPAGSGITITDASNGLCDVDLEPSDTSSLQGIYYHELRILDSLGNKTVLANGTLTILPSNTIS